MSEQTKHERFVSEETLEQIASLIEPLSNCLDTPMTLFDADGGIFYRSTNSSPNSFDDENSGLENPASQECCERLRDRLKTVYDTPVMEKCDSGSEIIAVPIKTERQFPTKIKKQFIGMLCFNAPSENEGETSTWFDREQICGMVGFIENLLRQIAMRNQDLGELVSQLLGFQNELTMSYQFSSAATDNMDVDSLFQKALKLIQTHINPKEVQIVVQSDLKGGKTESQSFGLTVSEQKNGLLNNILYRKIVEKALKGVPVVINSYNGYGQPKRLDVSAKSILAMPIRAGKDVFGVIILVDKENGEMFLADDENFVTSLTNSLGMVLKHVDLAKEVVRMEKASVEKQRQIVARVVHKMRNQLVAMKGNMRWIDELCAVEEIDQEALAAALAGVDRNFRDASKVISGFLKYVAPEQFEPEDTNISSLVSETAEGIRKGLDKDVLIEEELSQELPRVRIDSGVFRSVIEELIMNATQHLNGDGRILLRTALASDTEVKLADAPINGKYLAVEVSDNGPGISDDIRSRIFDLGFSTRSMGTGLGLSIVKRDIERSNGRIVEMGKTGADFLIVLPVSRSI